MRAQTLHTAVVSQSPPLKRWLVQQKIEPGTISWQRVHSTNRAFVAFITPNRIFYISI